MDYEARRDPDAILRQIVEEEAAEGDTRGKLKIFFGYAAGVGKTSVTSNPTRGPIRWRLSTDWSRSPH